MKVVILIGILLIIVVLGVQRIKHWMRKRRQLRREMILKAAYTVYKRETMEEAESNRDSKNISSDKIRELRNQMNES